MDTPIKGWWLHCSAILRQAVPVHLCIITNQHDNTTADAGHDATPRIPIDEVLGWTDVPQLALDFLTVNRESVEDWIKHFIPIERQPMFKCPPGYAASTSDKQLTLDDALAVPWPKETPQEKYKKMSAADQDLMDNYVAGHFLTDAEKHRIGVNETREQELKRLAGSDSDTE